MSRAANYDDRQFMAESLASKMLNWRAARGKSILGTAKSVILCLGDSTDVGTGSIALGAGLKNLSWPTKLTGLLNTAGFKAGWENCIGTFGYGALAPTYDTRLSLGSWTQTTAINSVAGGSYMATATTASPLTFTPGKQTNTCEIYYVINTNTGSFNANVNGGSSTLTNTLAAANVGKVTITGALGNNVYNVTWASGGTVYILGFNAYNSADVEISVINAGKGSGRAGDVAALFAGTAAHLASFSPSVMVVSFGINEWLGAVALATYTANLQAIIAAKPATCDLIMISPLQSSAATIAFALQQPYLDAFRDVAIAAGAIYIDQNARTGGFNASNAAGMQAADGVHGNGPMYFDEAMAIRDVLLAA